MKKLSVVLATRNEQENIGVCLESVKKIADEIIVVDESSIDKTTDIAKSYGAKVYKVKHEPIFHITKQKALDYATGDWVLQLDADERVSKELATEIKKVINLTNNELLDRVLVHPERSPEPFGLELKVEGSQKIKLFEKHQKLIEQRDSKIGKPTGEVVALFIPRRNIFLRKPLIYAGVYPDGVIRLFKRGKARFPAKSVHEQIEIDGEVGWLFNDLEHHDSPTFQRYLIRMNRYTDLHAEELALRRVGINYFQLFNYSTIIPFSIFFRLYIRHKGFLDGIRGFIWSLFSALHFPIAYFKYWQKSRKD